MIPNSTIHYPAAAIAPQIAGFRFHINANSIRAPYSTHA